MSESPRFMFKPLQPLFPKIFQFFMHKSRRPFLHSASLYVFIFGVLYILTFIIIYNLPPAYISYLKSSMRSANGTFPS